MESDPSKYLAMILDYHIQLETLIEEAQIKLLTDLNLDREYFQASIMKWVQLGKLKELVIIQTLQRQKLK